MYTFLKIRGGIFGEKRHIYFYEDVHLLSFFSTWIFGIGIHEEKRKEDTHYSSSIEGAHLYTDQHAVVHQRIRLLTY